MAIRKDDALYLKHPDHIKEAEAFQVTKDNANDVYNKTGINFNYRSVFMVLEGYTSPTLMHLQPWM